MNPHRLVVVDGVVSDGEAVEVAAVLDIDRGREVARREQDRARDVGVDVAENLVALDGNPSHPHGVSVVRSVEPNPDAVTAVGVRHVDVVVADLHLTDGGRHASRTRMEQDCRCNPVVHGLQAPNHVLRDLDLLAVATVDAHRVDIIHEDHRRTRRVEDLPDVVEMVPADRAALGELQTNALGPHSHKGVGVVVLVVGAEGHHVVGDADGGTSDGGVEPANQNPICT